MGRRLHFDEEATRRLIRRYLELNYKSEDILKPVIVSENKGEEYSVTSEIHANCAKIIATGEEHIRKHGHGMIPPKNRNDLTGLRYIPVIEAKLGRRITNNEWNNMSIR
jgi:hypothetical protein